MSLLIVCCTIRNVKLKTNCSQIWIHIASFQVTISKAMSQTLSSFQHGTQWNRCTVTYHCLKILITSALCSSACFTVTSRLLYVFSAAKFCETNRIWINIQVMTFILYSLLYCGKVSIPFFYQSSQGYYSGFQDNRQSGPIVPSLLCPLTLVLTKTKIEPDCRLISGQIPSSQLLMTALLSTCDTYKVW